MSWLSDNDDEDLVAIRKKLKKFKIRKKRSSVNQNNVQEDVRAMNEDVVQDDDMHKNAREVKKGNEVVHDIIVKEYDVDSNDEGSFSLAKGEGGEVEHGRSKSTKEYFDLKAKKPKFSKGMVFLNRYEFRKVLFDYS